MFRHADDPYEKVRFHARLVAGACTTGRFWVDPLQRPMHFYPKLRSQPWWDVGEFPWVSKLVEHFEQIRDEVMRMRQPLDGKKARPWDTVGVPCRGLEPWSLLPPLLKAPPPASLSDQFSSPYWGRTRTTRATGSS